MNPLSCTSFHLTYIILHVLDCPIYDYHVAHLIKNGHMGAPVAVVNEFLIGSSSRLVTFLPLLTGKISHLCALL